MDKTRLDEAVSVAVSAFGERDGFVPFERDAAHWNEKMRAALLAALPVLLGEVVKQMDDCVLQEVEPDLDTIDRWRFELESLYAPDLGGGK